MDVGFDLLGTGGVVEVDIDVATAVPSDFFGQISAEGSVTLLDIAVDGKVGVVGAEFCSVFVVGDFEDDVLAAAEDVAGS